MDNRTMQRLPSTQFFVPPIASPESDGFPSVISAYSGGWTRPREWSVSPPLPSSAIRSDVFVLSYPLSLCGRGREIAVYCCFYRLWRQMAMQESACCASRVPFLANGGPAGAGRRACVCVRRQGVGYLFCLRRPVRCPCHSPLAICFIISFTASKPAVRSTQPPLVCLLFFFSSGVKRPDREGNQARAAFCRE